MIRDVGDRERFQTEGARSMRAKSGMERRRAYAFWDTGQAPVRVHGRVSSDRNGAPLSAGYGGPTRDGADSSAAHANAPRHAPTPTFYRTWQVHGQWARGLPAPEWQGKAAGAAQQQTWGHRSTVRETPSSGHRSRGLRGYKGWRYPPRTDHAPRNLLRLAAAVKAPLLPSYCVVDSGEQTSI